MSYVHLAGWLERKKNNRLVEIAKSSLVNNTKEIQMSKKRKVPKLYRQGDVLLVRVDEYPKEAKKLDTLTVALGEVTGHHHTFKRGVEVMEVNGDMWVVAEEEAELEHQEHSTIIVDPGIYKVRIQREYEPKEGSRRVFD